MDEFAKYTNYKTILSVNALIWCNEKVLLMKRSKNKKVDPGVYSGIGGKVEPHESFYDALLREIEEETGISEFESIRPYSVTQHPYPPTDSEWVNLYFIVNIKDQVRIKPTEDGTFHWFDPAKISGIPMVTDLKEYIKIMSENKNAFILGFFDNDKEGKLIEKRITVL